MSEYINFGEQVKMLMECGFTKNQARMLVMLMYYTNTVRKGTTKEQVDYVMKKIQIEKMQDELQDYESKARNFS